MHRCTARAASPPPRSCRVRPRRRPRPRSVSWKDWRRQLTRRCAIHLRRKPTCRLHRLRRHPIRPHPRNLPAPILWKRKSRRIQEVLVVAGNRGVTNAAARTAEPRAAAPAVTAPAAVALAAGLLIVLFFSALAHARTPLVL